MTQAPTFYSRLLKAAEETLPATVDAASLRNRLEKSKYGLSPAEWTGTFMPDFLQARTGRVTKDEVLQHIRENLLKVTPVDLGKVHRKFTIPGDRPNTFWWEEAPESLASGYSETGLTSNLQPWAGHNKQAEDLASRQNRAYDDLRIANNELNLAKSEANLRDAYRRGLLRTDPGGAEKDLGALETALNAARARKRIHDRIFDDFQYESELATANMNLPYDEPHYLTPANIEAHLRMSDRNVGITNAPSRHIDELQSSWHQSGEGVSGYTPVENEELIGKWKGRTKYLEPLLEESRNLIQAKRNALMKMMKADQSGSLAYFPSVEDVLPIDDAKAYNRLKHDEMLASGNLKKAQSGNLLPLSPFRKSWKDIGLKHALYKAAEADVPYLTWTRGEYLPHIVGSLESGAVKFMNEDIPSRLEKILKPFGGTESASQLRMLQGSGIPDVYASAGIAESLGVSPATIYRWMREDADPESLKELVAHANPMWSPKAIERMDWEGVASKIFDSMYKVLPEVRVPVNAIALPQEVRKRILSQGFNLL